MYSRNFSDREPIPPPEYGGTAWRREREEHEKAPPPKGRPPCKDAPRGEAPSGEEHAHKESPSAKEEGRRKEEGAEREGIFGKLLPFGIKEEDLLLLGIALLLLLDGCEDRYLPFILLFLLIVH